MSIYHQPSTVHENLLKGIFGSSLKSILPALNMLSKLFNDLLALTSSIIETSEGSVKITSAFRQDPVMKLFAVGK